MKRKLFHRWTVLSTWSEADQRYFSSINLLNLLYLLNVIRENPADSVKGIDQLSELAREKYVP